MKGWLDKYEYGGQAGYTDIPFKYNSAWGGQFQNGGISFLSIPQEDPEMMYTDRFNTPLNKKEEKLFNEWVAEESQRQGRDIMMDKGAYDVQGFWKSGDYKKMDQDNHGTDTWKKPNHPTFSNQSKYHGIDGFYGGNWTQEAGYQPSKQTADIYGPSYYNWLFGREPERPEHLDASRFISGANSPSPLYFAMGGSLPGAVGFTYARTKGIPSEGPYAKKTLPSAQKGKEVTYTHEPGQRGEYRLQRTITPYTSNRDIKRFTEAPTDPRQVNFLQNYAGAISGYQDDPDFVYPTQVPIEGDKHWNIDRFIIDPQFSGRTASLYTTESTAEQNRANTLADMYKYYMLQDPEHKGRAFRKAKRFVRNEVDSRTKGPFLQSYNTSTEDPTFKGWQGTSEFASQNRLKDLYWNEAIGEGTITPEQIDKLKNVSIDYFRNYKKLSKKEAEAQWNQWEEDAAAYVGNRKYEMANPGPQRTKTVPKEWANLSDEDLFDRMQNLPVDGEIGWNVDYKDVSGKNATKHFATNREAEQFYNTTPGVRTKYSDVSSYEKKENGGSMSYYQHGLDWKPKSISRDGSEVPKNQDAKFVLPRYDMPRAASESTAILRDKGKKTTATTGQKEEDVAASTKAMGKAKKTEREEEKARVAERKSAVAAKDKGKPFTLPSGETKKYEDMDAREKMYVSGKALEQRGRFNEDEESFLDEYINPLNLIGSMAGGLGTAPYEARESDSNLPYLTAIGAPLAVGAMGFDPLGSAMKVPGKVAQSMESGLLSKFSKPTSLNFSSAKPVVNTARNLEDLQAAKNFAQQYGYELPENLERISQSDELTNRTIRGMMNRHNTFVRGVSTNWDVLAEKNPEILRHLEGKGFDLSTKEGTQAAAEYMATHIPIQTGYGRASLNTTVFDRGMDGLYTSNSIPTAEGYTYGQGYITKVKRPTDFSSTNRQNWINVNNPSYHNDRLQNFHTYSVDDNDITPLLTGYDSEINIYNKIKAAKGDPEKLNDYKKFLIADMEDDLSFAIRNPKMHGGNPAEISKKIEDIKKLDFTKLKIKIDDDTNIPSLLRTERAKSVDYNNPFSFNSRLNEFIESKGKNPMSTTPGTAEGEKLYQDIINLQKSNLTDNKLVIDYLRQNHPDFFEPNKYAHYIHLGTPGEKVLQPIKSWEITPEIWKNKSRAHTNKYTKKLSALEEGGVIKDDRGQWAHPGEITEIGSNEITMQGVPYPVLGISDQGDTQMMFPEQEYKFKGKKVTEYPLKKSTGGWLDKY